MVKILYTINSMSHNQDNQVNITAVSQSIGAVISTETSLNIQEDNTLCIPAEDILPLGSYENDTFSYTIYDSSTLIHEGQYYPFVRCDPSKPLPRYDSENSTPEFRSLIGNELLSNTLYGENISVGPPPPLKPLQKRDMALDVPDETPSLPRCVATKEELEVIYEENTPVSV